MIFIHNIKSAKNKLDEFLTIEEELLKYKEDAIKNLEATIDLSLYSMENRQIVSSLLEEAKNLIANVATNNDEVNQIVENVLKYRLF